MRFRIREDASVPVPRVTYRTCNPAGVWTNWYTFTPSWALKRLDCCWDELHPGPPWRSGGPCDIRSMKTDSKVFAYKARTINPTLNPQWVEARFSCAMNPLSYFDADAIRAEDPEHFRVHHGFTDTSSYGATGWAKARPGQQTADLAQFIAEFRDVPRTLKATAEFFKNSWNAAKSGVGKTSTHAADSWLALNFGWMPFVADLRKFAKTYENVNKQIYNLRKHNNRWVKRTRNVAATSGVTLDVSDISGFVPTNFGSYTYYFCNNWGSPGLYGRRVITKEADFRFVGRFKYWIPNVMSDRWESNARRKLFGLNLTPALVWELTPFSWLVDWASNVGDVLSNLDNGLAENLVASYAYIIGSQKMTVTYTGGMSNLRVPFHGSWQYSLGIKDRIAASPFGFALTGADFSLRQWSLISAVGLQRMKFGG